MLSHVLFLATAAAEQPEAASGITKIFVDFGIDVPKILAQVLSFSVVAFLLYKFAWKPVLATLDERQRRIEEGLKYAEQMKAQLETAGKESTAILKTAQAESTRLIEEARKTAKDFLDRQTKEAAEKSAQIIAKAEQAIQLEHKKMLADARGEIARLVVATTQRVLARELPESDKTRYAESAAHELSKV